MAGRLIAAEEDWSQPPAVFCSKEKAKTGEASGRSPILYPRTDRFVCCPERKAPDSFLSHPPRVAARSGDVREVGCAAETAAAVHP